MCSNSETHSSTQSLIVPLSVKNQTKDKFDALLNAAMQKKRTRKRDIGTSKEELLNNNIESITSSENLPEKSENIGLKELNKQKDENYILNKFFDNQTKQTSRLLDETDNSIVVKPPVPKPRRIKCVSPTASQGTFEVTSPKIVKNLKNDNSSSSNKTYNVESVGDILVHKTPQKSKIIVMKNATYQDSDKSDSEILTDSKSKTFTKENDSTDIDNIEEVDNDDKNANSDSITQINETAKETTQRLTESKKNYSYGKITEIIIHKTDRLELNSFVVHPVIKIHVSDIRSGKYLCKSDKARPVVFFYENKDTDYISPVMTHTYNLQEKRMLYPSWEESILLNEDYEYFTDNINHIMLFFEVHDFVPVAMWDRLNEKGWYNIAFAFLKLSGKNGATNMGKKVRLQLYYPHHLKRNEDPQICNPWIWWKTKKLKKYPSTLYVTINSIISPNKVVETIRSKTPVQRESSSRMKLCDDNQQKQLQQQNEETVLSSGTSTDNLRKESLTWSRKPGEICKIPNNCLVKFNSYDQGCFVMKFSYKGLYLACGIQHENLFYIALYSMISFKELHKFPCHQGLIYCIRWSVDDSFLISASADNTVSVLSLSTYSVLQILPHPSFVYCCDIEITNEAVIASGCYDKTLRIWKNGKSNQKTKFHLFQELVGHQGYLTSICFNKNSNIFSSDSVGVIIEWCKDKEDWKLKRKISLLDVKETIINQIMLFPKARKMLVHSRDDTIRIIDVKSACVLQWLRGASNKRYQLFSSISPCGTYVVSGSENNCVHVWNSKTGKEIASYVPFSSDSSFLEVHCVDFHPCDNMMAISHYGRNMPILIYHFDQSMDGPTCDPTTLHTSEGEINFKKHFEEVKVEHVEKNLSHAPQNKVKVSFKSILQKMDSVIVSQKF